MGLNGYIKLHRKMIDWGWYSDPIVKDVFLHILLTANITDGEYRGYKLKAGQTVIGLNALAKKLGYSTQQVRTALKKLEYTGEISKKSTNKFTIVTVEKWELYQTECSDDNKRATNEQQTSNKRVTNEQQHLKKKKNTRIQEEKEYNNPPTPLQENLLNELLMTFSFSEIVESELREWIAYKREIKEPYKTRKGLNSLLKQVEKYVLKYGDHRVVEHIEYSISRCWKGVNFQVLDDMVEEQNKRTSVREKGEKERVRFIDLV